MNLRSLITALAMAAALSPAAQAATASKTFTVTNTGNGPLTVSGAAISGNTSEYALTENTCTSVTPGSSCTMTVTFAPTTTGSRPSASLDFSSSGLNGPTHAIALNGAGGRPTSCKNRLESAPGAPSGTYIIDPDGSGPVAEFSVYCDMVTDGGGWTRVNQNVVQSSSKPFGANDVVSGNNVSAAACSPNTNWYVSNPVIAYSAVKLEFTRTTTIMQCAGLHSGSGAAITSDSHYWNGATWVSNSTCVWNDYIWAGAGLSAAGLPKTWRVLSGKPADNAIRFTTQCSGSSSDSGAYSATLWLR